MGMSGIVSRVNQRASSISSRRGQSPSAHSAVKPSMREWGRAGWLPKYFMFYPDANFFESSLDTASSRLSPGSTKPASTLNRPLGKRVLRAAAFVFFGYCHYYGGAEDGVGDVVAVGAGVGPVVVGGVHGAPHRGQNRLLRFQSIIWKAVPADWKSFSPPRVHSSRRPTVS